jgi:hypothetical protein
MKTPPAAATVLGGKYCFLFALCVLGVGCASLKVRRECPVHGVQLKEIRGYTFGEGVALDPSEDYTSFMDKYDEQKVFPCAIPWYFTIGAMSKFSKPDSVSVCSVCQAKHDNLYASFTNQRIRKQ